MDVKELTQLILENPAGIIPRFKDDYPLTPVGEINAPRELTDAAQLEALKTRFAALRDEIPMLKKLADSQNIDRVEHVEDITPLLFEHTMYKSYPPSLLEKGQFQKITQWLNKLTTHDLTRVDVSECESIDAWLDVLDAETPVRVTHSSGTSGTMSFLPVAWSEERKLGEVRRAGMAAKEPNGEMPELYMVHPWFKRGRVGQLRAVSMTLKHLLPDEEHLRTAYPLAFSSDVQYLSARLAAAHRQGTLDRIEISPYQEEKRQEYEALQAGLERHLAEFFSEIADELKGRRVYMGAVWNLLHNMAKAGLEKGFDGVFSPESVIITGGGAKGMVRPEGWMEDVKRFTGVSNLHEMYGMTEIMGTAWMCEEGHYHLPPTTIPFILDPDTSRPLPREGRVKGRAAFFDLGADARWGGFITGDEITIEWDAPCPCGRPGRYLVDGIQRYSEKSGGDDKITCAATEDSHREAMNFLNDF